MIELDLTTKFTAARARNAGLAALTESAQHIDYVQFIDGDCELDPAWIATARAFLDAHPQVAVVCGRRRERFPQASIYNALCDREWNTPVGEAEACGGDALMRRTALDAVGAYNPALIAGEEPEMCARLRVRGWAIWRIDSEMTLHDAALTRFGQWWTRARRAGFAYAQVASVRTPDVPDIFAGLRRRALFWGVGVPTLALVSLIVMPIVVVLIGIVLCAQIIRVARRDTGPNRYAYAAFSLLAKLPEAIGIAQFHIGALRKRDHGAILYK